MFAFRELSEDLMQQLDIDNCEPSVFETNLTLLGATALEDLLQENCKECISDFKEAGIKMWMLTGDKGETAQNIGITCGIINNT